MNNKSFLILLSFEAVFIGQYVSIDKKKAVTL